MWKVTDSSLTWKASLVNSCEQLHIWVNILPSLPTFYLFTPRPCVLVSTKDLFCPGHEGMLGSSVRSLALLSQKQPVHWPPRVASNTHRLGMKMPEESLHFGNNSENWTRHLNTWTRSFHWSQLRIGTAKSTSETTLLLEAILGSLTDFSCIYKFLWEKLKLQLQISCFLLAAVTGPNPHRSVLPGQFALAGCFRRGWGQTKPYIARV